MSKDNDGGPAFPPQVVRDGDGLLQEVSSYGRQCGMSLRDYFAASALPWCMEHAAYGVEDGLPLEPKVAKTAYAIADAMLAARAA